jgi:hypothetical protein
MTEDLPRAAAAVVIAARRHGLELEVREFPEGTRTAADAARAIGCHVDQIVKSLVFVADTDPVLVLTSGGNRVDVVKVGKERSAAVVRKADASSRTSSSRPCRRAAVTTAAAALGRSSVMRASASLLLWTWKVPGSG